jgi:hypothetical protein
VTFVRIKLLGLAAATLAAPAAYAEEKVGSGYVGAFFQADSDNTNSDPPTYGAEASGTLPLRGRLNVQADGLIARSETGGTTWNTYAGTLHAYFREDRFRVGAFVGGVDADKNIDLPAVFAIGGEGQLYPPSTILTGALGVGKANVDGADTFALAYASAAFYPQVNWRIGVKAGYTEYDDANGFTYGVGSEYRLFESPLSIYADYAHMDFEGYRTDAVRVGVRVNFQDETLTERDSRGAGLPSFYEMWR